MKLVVIFLILAGVAFGQGPQRNNIFFGTHMASPSGTIVYPAARSLPFGIMRVWDANTGCNGTAWEKVNTADGVFDYSCMDALVAIAATNQKELIYTFGRTPNWASSSPADATCSYTAGSCDPPTDLTKFQTFANNMVQRYGGTTAGKVKYWECWNEPNLQRFYNGTVAGNIAKLVTICGYVRAAINTYCPTCVLNSPAPTSTGDYTTGEGVSYVGGPQLFLNDYFSRSGDADVLDYHNYSDAANPEGSAKVLVDEMVAVTARAGRPIWNTEFATTPGTPEYVSRTMIYLAARDEISRSIWYGWDYDTRGQWLSTVPGDLTPTGWASYQVFTWLNTATFTDSVDATTGARCTCTGNNCPNIPASSQVWVCNISKPGGYTARIVWDKFGTSAYTVSPFTKYRTVDNGNLKAIIGSTISIGIKPLLLE